MEIWDAYNEAEIKVGIDLIRGEKIDEGLLHAVVVIIVYHEDGTYLLMQRDWKKAKFPGLWEAGASGCVLKSESFLEAAKRELFEETGIVSAEFKLIYSSINAEVNAFFKVFLCTCNIDKNNIVLQKGETIDFRWASSKELINFIDSEYFINPFPKELKQYVMSNQ
jgi:8-oxo-dGTP pyrophosphatase MutT (NUDIX family)